MRAGRGGLKVVFRRFRIDLIRLPGIAFEDIVFRDRPGDVVRLLYPGDRLLISGPDLDPGDFSAADFLLA